MGIDSNRLGRPAEILLVEDNDDDVFIARKVFGKIELNVNLNHVENGLECLKFLRKQNAFTDSVTPDLVLLDLNMPIMDGREVMIQILKDEELRKIPIVVLTTSDDEKDLSEMYRLRCNSYITKPVDYLPFKTVIEQLTRYWFQLNHLPPNPIG